MPEHEHDLAASHGINVVNVLCARPYAPTNARTLSVLLLGSGQIETFVSATSTATTSTRSHVLQDPHVLRMNLRCLKNYLGANTNHRRDEL